MASLPNSQNTHDVLETVYSPGVDASAVWETVHRLLRENGLAEERYTFDYKTEMPDAQIGPAIRHSRRSAFHVAGRRCSIYLVRQGQYEIDVVYISAFRNDLRGGEDEWVSELAGATNGLISARVYDLEFEFWQNEKDLNAFREAGRPLGDRRLTLDPVFDEPVVDLSHSPGRTMWRLGYKEALGPIMWLTAEFWSRVGMVSSIPAQLPNAVELRPLLWRVEFEREAFRGDGDPAVLGQVRFMLFGNTGALAG